MTKLAGLKKKVMGVVDFIMPPLPADEYGEDEVTEEESVSSARSSVSVPASATEMRVEDDGYRVANGGVVYGSGEYDTVRTSRKAARENGPKLTVHTTKQLKLNIGVYAPRDFDQVCQIASDIREGKAAIVNYEQLEAEEQRRICDFLNGTCYVLDGCPRRVSQSMVLYVPDGVDVEDAEVSIF